MLLVIIKLLGMIDLSLFGFLLITLLMYILLCSINISDKVLNTIEIIMTVCLFILAFIAAGFIIIGLIYLWSTVSII